MRKYIFLLFQLLWIRLQLVQSFTVNLKEIEGKRLSRVDMSQNSSGGYFLLSNQDLLSNDGPKRLILASQSPRRREILDMMGLKDKYTVQPSPLDEEKLQMELSGKNLAPKEYTKILAESKANALVEHLISIGHKKLSEKGETFVLGSDTIVDLDGKILEKPKGRDSAVEMLTALSGQWHEVHTGVALYQIDHSQVNMPVQCVSSYTETSRVKFSSLR